MKLALILSAWVVACAATTATHQVVQLTSEEPDPVVLGEAARTKLHDGARVRAAQRAKEIPGAPETVHPEDAHAPSSERGINNGRSLRNSEELQSLMRKREALIQMLHAIRNADPNDQARLQPKYKETVAALVHVETEMGMPQHSAEKALQKMNLAIAASKSDAVYVSDYEQSKNDLKSALSARDEVPTGLYKQYKENHGHSDTQDERWHNENSRLRGQERARQQEHNLLSSTQKESQENYLYEAEGAPRPGGAFDDGTDHKESDIPGAVPQIKANYIQPRSVTLTWSVPPTNRALVTGYEIVARKGDSGEFSVHTSASGGLNHVMKKMRGLYPGQKYQVKIQALYVPLEIRQMSLQQLQHKLLLLGKGSYEESRQRDTDKLRIDLAVATGTKKGPFSSVFTFTTLPTVPDPPKNVIAAGMAYRETGTEQECQLSWKAPEPNGSPITGYRILQLRGGGTAWDWVEIVHNTASASTSATITGLEAGGVQYVYKVAAINNEGVGKDSVPSQGIETHKAKAPAAPQGLECRHMTCDHEGCKCRLAWREPSGRGATITGYKVENQKNNHGEFSPWTDNTGDHTTSLLLEKLSPGVTFLFKVAGISEQGLGDFSQALSIKTPAQAPKAPGKPVWGDVTGTTVKLTWDPPEDNGAPITGYRVLFQLGGAGGFFPKIADTRSTEPVVTVTGLKQGGYSYQFKIQAINKIGVGKPSPFSDPCATAYEEHLADKHAVAKASESFRINHKLHQLRALTASLKLSQSRLKDMQDRYRVSKERGLKAEDKVQELQQLVNTNAKLSAKRLSVERVINAKQANIEAGSTAQIAQITAQLNNRQTKDAQEVASTRLAAERAAFAKIAKQKDDEIEDLRDQLMMTRNQLHVASSKIQRLKQRAENPERVELRAPAPQFIINP